MIKHKKTIILALWFLHSLCHAFQEPHTSKYDHDIHSLQHTLSKKNHFSKAQRLEYISEAWLNKPYLLFALGEGPHAPFDQHPLYRTDAFDCETYVDTVLAITLSDNLPAFKQKMNQIRYQDGQVDFLKRNHFTGLDWNTNNQKQGFVEDITPQIQHQHHSIHLISKTPIHKANWYQHLQENRIYLPRASQHERWIQLQKLKTLGRSFKPKTSEVTYLPLNRMLNNKGHLHRDIIEQIPNGVIMEIVRPQWNLEKQIGTHLDISHLGFIIRKDGVLYFRNASSTHQKVIDEKLELYLRKCLKSPTIKGIHLEKIS